MKKKELVLRPSPRKHRKALSRETNKERAEYLSLIYPHQREVFEAVARFLGENKLI